MVAVSCMSWLRRLLRHCLPVLGQSKGGADQQGVPRPVPGTAEQSSANIRTTGLVASLVKSAASIMPSHTTSTSAIPIITSGSTGTQRDLHAAHGSGSSQAQNLKQPVSQSSSCCATMCEAGRAAAPTAVVKAHGTADTAAGNTAATEHCRLQDRYTHALRPFMLTEYSLIGSKEHHFMATASSCTTAAGGEGMRKRLRHISEELGVLATSLPLTLDSAVLLAVDEERVDVLRACCFPAPDTPYACGAFLFDILLPATYPEVPPKVHFLTTGKGTVGFNPNFYNNGYVCLSLLNTWSGPSWQPSTSSLLQVLVSLQGLVFVEHPWFNEPGRDYHQHKKTSWAQASSRAYNETTRKHTLRFGILEALRSPDRAFAATIRAHFAVKGSLLRQQCKRWLEECKDGANKSAMQDLVADIGKELDKLLGSAGDGQACTSCV